MSVSPKTRSLHLCLVCAATGALGAIVLVRFHTLAPGACWKTRREVVSRLAQKLALPGFGRKPSAGVNAARRRIARVAMETVRTKAMGKYVLGRNDCSNFVGRAVERGAGIRLPNHDFDCLTREELQYFSTFTLPVGAKKADVLPGDVMWLVPRNGISHIGVVGTDHRVYHFSKLRGKPQRYAAESLPVFLKHFACGLRECIVFRLVKLPIYRNPEH